MIQIDDVIFTMIICITNVNIYIEEYKDKKKVLVAVGILENISK